MEKNKNKRRVISHNNLPFGFPFWQTIILALVIDRMTPSRINAVFIGIAIAIFAMWWALAIGNWAIQEQVDVIDKLDRAVYYESDDKENLRYLYSIGKRSNKQNG